MVLLYQVRNEDKIYTAEKVTDIKCILYTRPEGEKKLLKYLGSISITGFSVGNTQIMPPIPATSINGCDYRRAGTQVIYFHSRLIYIGWLL